MTQEIVNIIITVLVVIFITALILSIVFSQLSTKEAKRRYDEVSTMGYLTNKEQSYAKTDLLDRLFNISLITAIITMVVLIMILFILTLYKQGHF